MNRSVPVMNEYVCGGGDGCEAPRRGTALIDRSRPRC
jgi:hypothetical protein